MKTSPLHLSDPVPQVRAQAVQLAARRLNDSPALLEKVMTLAADADPRVRFQTALALGDSSDPRVGKMLLSIARRDAANHWIRAAVLSSCDATAHRLDHGSLDGCRAPPYQRLKPNCSNNWPRSSGRGTSLLKSIASLIVWQLDVHDPSRLALRDRLVIGLARGLRRSGGQLPVAQVPTSPGTSLVSHLIQQAKTKALDGQAPELARVEAIDTLSTLDPAESHPVLLELLEPEPATGRTDRRGPGFGRGPLGRYRGNLAASASRIRASSSHSRGADTFNPRKLDQGHCFRLSTVTTCRLGITPALIDLADRAPLMKHSDAEIARLAQSIFTQTAPRPRAQVISEYPDRRSS